MASSTTSDSPGRQHGFSVGPGMHVALEYCVRDADGDSVGADVERLEAVIGMGQLLPAIEQAIDGQQAGDVKRLKLLARDAYGPRVPDAVLEVEREEFPDDVGEGDYFEVENAEGELLVLRILEVGDDFVLVDLNHPLAGQDLQVELNILSVRPADQDEIDRLLNRGVGKDVGGAAPLISPASLLRGRLQR